MSPEEFLIIVAVFIGALFAVGWAIVLVLGLGAYLVTGAMAHIAWANEYGFLGVAAYVALWVIATPFMFIISIIAGCFILREEQNEDIVRWPTRSSR